MQWGPLVCASIHDKEALKLACNQYSPLAVIHLASYINVRESQFQPARYYQNNTLGTLTLLEVMEQQKVPHLVFSSTAAVYGIPEQVPIHEAHPKAPINPYGKSKWMAEGMIDDMGASHGISSICLRYFNASGADPEGMLGEAHDPETHLIPLVIQAAIGRRPSLTINGVDHPTRDGTAIRDYIHVSDLAEAHIKALLWLMQNKKSLKLNLGTGQGFSIREVIASVEKHSNTKIPCEIAPAPPTDPPQLVADASQARELLQWRPCFSDLDTIVQTAYRWHAKAGLP